MEVKFTCPHCEKTILGHMGILEINVVEQSTANDLINHAKEDLSKAVEELVKEFKVSAKHIRDKHKKIRKQNEGEE